MDLSLDSKVIQGVKHKYLEKTIEILGIFANLWLNQVQNCCGQIENMKAGTFSFPLKKSYACQSLTDGAGLKNVPPPLDFTRTLKSYHKRND